MKYRVVLSGWSAFTREISPRTWASSSFVAL
jgi:hypothetical protein